MIIKEYPYKPKLWMGPFCALFFAGCALIFWLKIHDRPHGLTINHVIELSSNNAQLFHWLLFIGSILFSVMGIVVFVLSLKKVRHITITDLAISAPKNGFSNSMVEIPFNQIQSLQLVKVQHQRFLHIQHTNGMFSIMQSMLPSKAAFDELCALIEAQIKK